MATYINEYKDEDEKQPKQFMPNSNYKPPTPQTTGAGQAVNSVQNKPLNQNYNIMRGIMGGQQSDVAVSSGINETDRQGQAEISRLTNSANNYRTNNTLDRDYDVTKGYNEWTKDPSTESGQKFAQVMGRTNTPLASQYSATGNMQTPQTGPVRHTGVGNRALDLATQNMQQQANVANVTGVQNQNIGDLVKHQNNATSGVTAGVQATNANTINAQKAQGSVLAGKEIQNIQNTANKAGATLANDDYKKTLSDLDTRESDLKGAYQSTIDYPEFSTPEYNKQIADEYNRFMSEKPGKIKEAEKTISTYNPYFTKEMNDRMGKLKAISGRQ